MDGTLLCNSFPLSHCQLKHFSLPPGFPHLFPPSPPEYTRPIHKCFLLKSMCREKLLNQSDLIRDAFLSSSSIVTQVLIIYYASLSTGAFCAHPHSTPASSCFPGAQQGRTSAPVTSPQAFGTASRQPPPYPRASKAKLEEPPSVPSRSQRFGQHRVAVICCTCDGYCTPVQVSLLGMALLDHDSSHHTVPKPKMCLLPPMTLPHSQPLADTARRCFFLGWLGPAQQPECFPWFKHVPCSGL